MTKKTVSIALVLSLLLTPAVFAQGDAAPGQGTRDATTAGVTQAELAYILVDVLGLSRFLPAAPSVQEVVTMLLNNNISPFEGWNPERTVTRADLARVIVLAMEREGEVENPDNPASWIEYLASIGASIGTIGEAVDNLEPLPEAVAQNVFAVSATTDPLKTRSKFGEPDEREYGTDVEFVPHWRPVSMSELIEVIETVEFEPVERRRPPATPN